MEETLNIYQRLAKIRKPAEILQKNKSGYGYKYVSEDEILAKITGLMEKHHVSLIPTIVPGTTKIIPYHTVTTKSTRDGKVFDQQSDDILVQADMVWNWVNDDNPEERITVPWTLVGHQTNASQAFGSGLTYSSRYFLLKYFNISTTEDDPDSWRSKQQEAEGQEERETAKLIIAKVDETVNEVLNAAANPDKTREEIITIVKQYSKVKVKASGNYNNITDPVVAANLLKALQDTFQKEQE